MEQKKQSEFFYREQIEKILKESKALQQRVQSLESENMALKKSVFDLSTRLNELGAPGKKCFIPDFCDGTTVKESVHTTESTQVSASIDAASSNMFKFQHELIGHTGAVYHLKYSPCGRFLASASFDKTVRLWDFNSTESIAVLKKHTSSVSCISWHKLNSSSSMTSPIESTSGSPSMLELLSGSFDKTCKRWDINTTKCVDSFDTDGFVSCIQAHPTNQHIFFYGTTRKSACMVDKRRRDPVLNISIDGMVNALHVYSGGNMILTGDSSGFLKSWDVRNLQCLQSTLNDEKNSAISSISMCSSLAGADVEDEPRYMAVNSFDDVVRIYDRGWSPPESPPKLIHVLRGHKNKSLPIECSFFTGDLSMELGTDFDFVKSQAEYTLETGMKKSFRAFVLGTGSVSSSGFVYVASKKPSVQIDQETFDNSPANAQSETETSTNNQQQTLKYSSSSLEMADSTSVHVQKLDYHGDRVYACDFHPKHLIFATGSADFKIGIWKARPHRLSKVLSEVGN